MSFLKRVPIRLWIIVLIFWVWFLMGCFVESLDYTRKYVTLHEEPRYKPWCLFTDEEKLQKVDDPKLRIPWYNITPGDFGPRYKIRKVHQLLIHDAQFYGHMVASIPAGILAEYIGPFTMVFYSTIIVTILSILRVLFLSLDWRILTVSEFILGIHVGLTYPALIVWMARWAPPNERGIFVASQIATGIATSLSRLFILTMLPVIGWRAVFYNLSLVSSIFIVILWCFGYNQPEDHKRISRKELHYIKKSQRGRATATKSFPPLGEILCCQAFWAVTILYFGYNCSQIFFLKTMPLFLYSFIGVSRTTNNYIEILPDIGYVSVALTTALVADFIRTKKIMDDTVVAKWISVFSHILPGCLLLFVGVARCSSTIITILLFIGYGCSGCAILVCFRTIIDVSPNYSGTIHGFSYFFSCFLYIFDYKIRTEILIINDGIIGWTIVFLIGGGCLIGTGIIFIFFGLDQGQEWNIKSQDLYKLYLYKEPDRKRDKNGQKTLDISKKLEEESAKKDVKNNIMKMVYPIIKTKQQINLYEPNIININTKKEIANELKNMDAASKIYKPKRKENSLNLPQ